MDPTLKAPFVQDPRKRSPGPTRQELFVAYCSYSFRSPPPGSQGPTRQELGVLELLCSLYSKGPDGPLGATERRDHMDRGRARKC